MESNKKKRILYHSDWCGAKTGFGKNARFLLEYLYKSGKYEIIEYCCGINFSNPELQKVPWKAFGCLPDSQQELDQLNRDPNLQRMSAYGSYYIDRIIQQEKPDIYMGVQDFWGFDGYIFDKYWWNKIPCILHITLDSLPILDSAVKNADKIKNYYVWSTFAEEEMKRLGFNHVKTLHTAIDTKYFYRLPDQKRKELKKRFNIPEETFVMGMVARNQLRKSFPNLIEGYKIWKKNNLITKSALFFHTSYNEGWDINKLADEYKVNKDEILTTFICRNCKEYEIKKFTKHEEDCRFCGAKNAQITTNVGFGVTEEQLNEVYNLLDLNIHPFTSGGCEIPVLEAKLTELITLVTNYSCGEELCMDGSGSFPLDYAEYREFGTQFIKASTYPSSIAKQIDKIYRISPEDRRKIGKTAREWTLKNYSIETVGKQLENILDNLQITNYDFSSPVVEFKNPNASIPNIEDNREWVKKLYLDILKMEVNDQDQGLLYWLDSLSKGMKKQEVENYFRGVAAQENNKLKSTSQKSSQFEDLLDKDDKGRRIIYIIPESLGDVFLSTAVLESIKKEYPGYNLYVATKPENFEILDGNPNIFKILEYRPEFDNHLWLTGINDHPGYFDIAFHPYFGTQRQLDYLNNGKDSVPLLE